MALLTVENLWKTYIVKERKFLLAKKMRLIEALRGVSFEVEEGEFVGYLGPNGSGKSTTIKIITGIMHPDHGKVKALGFVPSKQRREYVRHIGVVLGQKSLLWWDLPVKDSLWLYKKIYGVSDKEFKDRLEEFDNILGLGEIIGQPVRKLSFGQRMKAEIAASLLHTPKIVFLDEPTIGLDVVAKENIRNFLKFINKEYGTTIVLTTHDLTDVEALCKRVILILDGVIKYDGPLQGLKKTFGNVKVVEIEFDPSKTKSIAELARLGNIKVLDRGYAVIEVEESKIKRLMRDIAGMDWVFAFNVSDPKLEEVVKRFYEGD